MELLRSVTYAILPLATILLAAFVAPTRAANPEVWGSLEPGPYGAGFRALETYDYSRPFAEGAPRPLQISVWYPAQAAADGPKLTIGDLAELIASETSFDVDGADSRSRARAILRTVLSPDFLPSLEDADLQRIFAVSTGAIADAPAARGRFPLLLWGKGEDGHALDHALLNEFLASHGYVVASTPALPQHARRVQRYDAASVQTQLRDLEFVIQALHDQGNLDLERIGVLAWSFGGLPAVQLTMRNPHVRALVSLDSRIGFRNPPEVLSALSDPDRVTVPLLHLTGSGEPRVERIKDSGFLDRLRYAENYRLTLAEVRHRDFNFLWGDLPRLAGVDGPWPRPPAEITRLIAEVVLTFLDATLLQRQHALEALDRMAREEAPPGVSKVVYRPGLEAPPTADDFLWVLTAEGATSAAAVWEEARDKNPDIQLFAAEELVRRSRDLLRSGELAEAEAVSRLTLEAYPSSAMSHYLLGQIAILDDEAETARDHYQRCLDTLESDQDLDETQRAVIRRDVENQLAKIETGGR